MPFVRNQEQLMARGRLPLLAAVMGAAFTIAGLTTIARIEPMVQKFEAWRIPTGLMVPVGLIVLAAAICLPVARTRALGASILAVLVAIALFSSRTTPITIRFLGLGGLFMLLALLIAVQPRRRFFRGPVR